MMLQEDRFPPVETEYSSALPLLFLFVIILIVLFDMVQQGPSQAELALRTINKGIQVHCLYLGPDKNERRESIRDGRSLNPVGVLVEPGPKGEVTIIGVNRVFDTDGIRILEREVFLLRDAPPNEAVKYISTLFPKKGSC